MRLERAMDLASSAQCQAGETIVDLGRKMAQLFAARFNEAGDRLRALRVHGSAPVRSIRVISVLSTPTLI